MLHSASLQRCNSYTSAFAGLQLSDCELRVNSRNWQSVLKSKLHYFLDRCKHDDKFTNTTIGVASPPRLVSTLVGSCSTTSLDDTDRFRVAVSFEGDRKRARNDAAERPVRASRAEMHKWSQAESFLATVRRGCQRGLLSQANGPAGKRGVNGKREEISG